MSINGHKITAVLSLIAGLWLAIAIVTDGRGPDGSGYESYTAGHFVTYFLCGFGFTYAACWFAVVMGKVLLWGFGHYDNPRDSQVYWENQYFQNQAWHERAGTWQPNPQYEYDCWVARHPESKLFWPDGTPYTAEEDRLWRQLTLQGNGSVIRAHFGNRTNWWHP